MKSTKLHLGILCLCHLKEANVTIGLICSVDLDHNIGTTPFIISDKELSNEEIEELIGKYRVLHLRKSHLMESRLT